MNAASYTQSTTAIHAPPARIPTQAHPATNALGRPVLLLGNSCRRLRLAPGLVVDSGRCSIPSRRSLLRAPPQIARREPGSGRILPGGRPSHPTKRPTVALDTSLQPFADDQPVEMTAHVTREGRLREASPNEIRQSLDVETEQIVTENGTRIPVHSGVRLGIYSEPSRRPVRCASSATANASACPSS